MQSQILVMASSAAFTRLVPVLQEAGWSPMHFLPTAVWTLNGEHLIVDGQPIALESIAAVWVGDGDWIEERRGLLSLLRLLEARAITVVNPTDALQLEARPLLQWDFFRKVQLPHPPYIVSSDPTALEAFLQANPTAETLNLRGRPMTLETTDSGSRIQPIIRRAIPDMPLCALWLTAEEQLVQMPDGSFSKDGAPDALLTQARQVMSGLGLRWVRFKYWADGDDFLVSRLDVDSDLSTLPEQLGMELLKDATRRILDTDDAADTASGLLAASSGTRRRDRLQVVTILFADVQGFTALSEQLEPDQVKFIMDHVLAKLTEEIEHHGGYIDKYMGDAVMAIFGIDRPGADDAYRAVKSALAMQDAIETLSRSLEKTMARALKLRIGINTGRVMVGSVAKGRDKDFTVMGDAVNLTQRLESNCPVGSILISESTQRQLRGSFGVKRMPPLQVKGKTDPVQTFQVIDDIPQELGTEGLEFQGRRIPLLGRDAELKTLVDAFEEVLDSGQARCVTMSGPQGVGKSAILHAFIQELDHREHRFTILSGRPDPDSADPTESTLVDIFRRRFSIRKAEKIQLSRRKLTAGLGRLAQLFDFTETVRNSDDGTGHLKILNESEVFLGHLLGLDYGDHPWIEELARVDQGFRNRVREVIGDLLRVASRDRPVVLLLESAHVIDSMGLRFFGQLLKEIGDVKVFLILVGHTGLQTHIDAVPGADSLLERHVELDPLEPAAVRAMAHAMLDPLEGEESFPFDRIVQVSNGLPYFIFEMCHYLLDKGALRQREDGYVWMSPDGALGVPDSVTGIIEARLGELSQEASDVIQRASVVGQNFWLGALGDASRNSTVLDELVEREFIRSNHASQIPNEREYAFTSSLVRETIRSSLPENRRRLIHSGVCDWLETLTIANNLEIQMFLAAHQRLAGRLREAFLTARSAANLAFEQASFLTAARMYEFCDKIQPSSSIFDVFRTYGQQGEVHERVASLDERIVYLERYLHAMTMSLTEANHAKESLCLRYISACERNLREEDPDVELSLEQRDDILRILWRTLLSVNREILTDEDFPKLQTLLGGPLVHPTSMGKAQLWFQMVKDLAMGRAYAKKLESFILGTESHGVNPGQFSENEPSIQYYLHVGWANYLYFARGDYDAAAKYAAAGSMIAYQQKWTKEIIASVCLFGCCLIGANRTQEAAQTFNYLDQWQERIGTHFERWVNLGNEAECYMMEGRLRVAELRYQKVVGVLQKHGIMNSSQTDAFSQFAILRLSRGPDEEIDTLLESCREMARKSNLLYNRWLRAKALSLWVNQNEAESGLTLLDEADQLAPNNSGELLRNLAVKHYILTDIDASRASAIRKELEERSSSSEEAAHIWSNVQATGHFLPLPQSAEEDYAYPVLNEQAIREMLTSYAS